MAWNILDNLTSTGNQQTDLVNLLASTSTGFPQFWAFLVILPLFVILTMRTFFKQQEKEGKGNIWSSLAVSSFVCSLVTVVMNLLGIVNNTNLIYVVSLTSLFGVIYILIKE